MPRAPKRKPQLKSSPSKSATKKGARGAPRKWHPEIPPTVVDLNTADELIAESNPKNGSPFLMFQTHFGWPQVPFPEAIRTAVATMLRDDLSPGTAKEYLADIMRDAGDALTRGDRRCVAAYRAAFERMAAHQTGRTASHADDDQISAVLDRIKDPEVHDVLLMMRSLGLRCADVGHVLTHNVRVERNLIEVRLVDTKTRKTRRQRAVLRAQPNSTWHFAALRNMLIQRIRKRPVHSVSEADAALQRHKKTSMPEDLCLFVSTTSAKGACSLAARVNGVLAAAAKRGEKRLTSYSFRLPFLAEAMERSRRSDGSIDFERASEITGHIAKDTLPGFYQRMIGRR